MLDAFQKARVSYIFGNFGSDHTVVIEGLARAKVNGINMPQAIICPHEIVALSAAHGYSLVTGEAQVVMVHCDVGTQNLGGAVHNASRARIPVLIFAGETPFTLGGELPGTRNRTVNFHQDIFDLIFAL
ncbi:hypothetical protein JI721_05260 [Alicyclobacillus cycloheptanicus]|uniref:thiamine pyrophosphate-binding protein n=1 Tax=Alicyclobacillus cycloheptanicus TaxID=1457 RepID=UPI002377DBF1|nr:thiamine pyrophosphate-binding protein [Alicyclobacillus cycloheptanicus]WDM02224.1 hypothetical protein JI721_05260 [Alicyclobacillus cycloheptanicus]